MFRVENVSKSFGSKQVLAGASFFLEDASIAGVIGPSGGGKSVLLKIIGGVTRPDRGVIERGIGPHDHVSLMFQEGALFDSLSVFDNVAFPLVAGRVPAVTLPAEERDRVSAAVSEILGHVGLSRHAFKMPGQISGGMRRRVSLARALVSRPRLLLLDDPTSGLDPVASSVIMDLIVDLHAEYRPTTLMVSHDLRRLFPVVDTIVALFRGKVVFSSALDELRRGAERELQRFVACRFDLSTKPGEVRL